ncbi:hypothetical protein [Larkinella arboricola]|uniref:Uncharacterized protein n=1 Tax=Larkinella arboricola TaxID=643671 RepID=A0A327WUD4_LARAB|nr:hypothetical protein [Larkinella arboricola]RAJ96040.1 hypothetical protein LX87_03790 [Larkinella arboricola]
MFFVLLSLFFQLAGNGQQPDYDLRSLRWDMTSKEVQAAERSAPFLKTDTTLHYRGRWFHSFPVSVKFAFAKDQLVGAQYIFTERHVRAQQHWDDYEAVARILTDRYGTPSGDYWNWNSELYKGRKERYGDAVLLGHLTRSNVWESARTIVTLEMSGKPTEGIYTVVSYAKKIDS